MVSKSLTADLVACEQWPEAFSVSTAATGLGLAVGYLLGGVRWSESLPMLKTRACGEAGGEALAFQEIGYSGYSGRRGIYKIIAHIEF